MLTILASGFYRLVEVFVQAVEDVNEYFKVFTRIKMYV